MNNGTMENIKKEKKHSLPKGWEIKKLGEVANVGSGNSAPQNKKLFENGIFPFFRTSDVGQIRKGFIGTSVNYLNENGIKSLKLFQKGTILLPKSGASTFLNHRVMMLVDGYVSSHLATIKAMSKIVDDKFLLYYLITIDAKDLIQNIAYPSLKISEIELIPIPLPPLSEQRRIVSILDKCFSAIEQSRNNAEQNLKNAKEIFESYLKGVFENKDENWEERKVKEIGNAQTGTTPKTAEKENYGDFIPFIKPADVDFSGIGDIRYDNEGLSEIGLKKGRKMEKNSILMVCIGATIGKVGYAERDISCNQQINSLTVKKEFVPKFFYYAMTSKEFQDKVLLEGKGAQATLPIINKTKWENLKISFPKSKEEQQAIVYKLDTLRIETQKLESIYQKKILLLEELKKSILQKAFNGELIMDN